MKFFYHYCIIVCIFIFSDIPATKHPPKDNTHINEIIILVHEEKPYPLSTIIFNTKKKKLICQRWQQVAHLKAEQQGLIDITHLKKNDFSKKNKALYQIKQKKNRPERLFFRYNWDGSSSKKDMEKSSCRLAKEIIELKKKYPDALLHFIGFSHGGNIILESAAFIGAKSGLQYDHVILLATPIGKKTEEWALKKKLRGNFFIKKISVFSSQGDYTQIKDFLFNFPICKKFITRRKHGVSNCYISFRYDDQFNFDSFIYHPNHENFWYTQKSFQLKSKSFLLPAIIFYAMDILTDTKNDRIKKIDNTISTIELLI
jgi:hypothetical protein